MIKEKIKLIKITKLKSDDKKYSAEFEVIKPSGKISKKTTKFGAAGMSDFTKHKDTERRERYISRHKKDLKTGNPIRAGYLSMYILWNKKSFSESVSDYKRRLNIYNKTGKFPTKISGSKLLKFGTPVSNIPFKETSLKVLPDEIQHKIEKEVFKKNMNLKNVDKMQLKNYLMKIKAENVNLRYVPLYRVLDEGDISTVIWLKLANKILKKSDFTINSLWTKIIINLLEEIESLRPYDNPRLNEHEFGIIEATINEIELLLMSKFNIYIDFESERGDWAEIAITELKEKINEDNYEQNYFGTKEGKKISFSDSKTIKMFEVDKLGKHKASGSGKPHIINAKLKELDKNDRQCILNFVIYVVEVVFKEIDKKTVLDFLQNDKYIETVTDRVFSDPNYKKMFPKCEVPEYYETWLNSNPQLLSFFVKKYYKNRKLAFGITNNFGITKNLNKQKELSKIPDNVINKPLYLRIKNKIKKEIGNKRRWGAYDSGRLVREYKARGGTYSGKKSNNKTQKTNKTSSDLSRWYKEKWIDACVWPKKKSCGRTKASIKSKVTYCRPSIRVDKNTPKTVQELSKTIIKKRCKNKSKNPKKIIRK